MGQERRPVCILSHDPGSKNYGIAVLKVIVPSGKKKSDVLNKFAFSILHVGRIESIFTSIKKAGKASEELASFRAEYQSLVKKHSPDIQIAERFMSRRMGGVTIELVNMTLGALRVYAEEFQIPLKMIPASQWKNELKRRGIDLAEVYTMAKMLGRTPHETDAVLIGLYGAFMLAGVKPFAVKDVSKLIEAVLTKMEKRD